MNGMNGQIGIVVAEAHPIARTAIEQLLIEEQDMKYLGEATSVCQAISLCESLEADILLLAPNVADYDPAESILRVQSSCPTVKVLIFSSCARPASLRAALNAGADGYVLKNEATETIVEAIRVVVQGDHWISPVLLSQQKAKQIPSLSKREKNVLGLTITGRTVRQMSQVLRIHERSVRDYLRQLYNKLGVDTQMEAAVQALRLELV